MKIVVPETKIFAPAFITSLEFEKLIERRSLKEPIAYIIKEKEFWSKKFIVDKGILIPRPETELMVEKLVKMFKRKKIILLDIGTGSGCILISLISELKKSFGIGIDISKKAISAAKKNALKHNVYEKIKLFNKSLTNLHNQKFDKRVIKKLRVEYSITERIR